MTNTMFVELEHLALALDQEDSLRVVILTGAGSAFCGGYDLADADKLAGLGALGMLDQQERAARALVAVRSMRVPVIAAINGAASGAVWRSPWRPTSGSPRPRPGSTPPSFASGSRPVISAPRGCSPDSWALRWRATSRSPDVSSTQTKRCGSVWSTGSPRPAASSRTAKRSLPTSSPTPRAGCSSPSGHSSANLEVSSYAAALELENRGQALLTRSPDMPEALAAFREKRPPSFTGA